MDFNAFVDQFAKIGPVLEVPRAPVNFMDDDARSLPFTELREHLVPHGPPRFRGGLALFEPFNDFQIVPYRVSLDGFLLFGQRYASFALPSRGDSDVAVILFQRFGWISLVGIDLSLYRTSGRKLGKAAERLCPFVFFDDFPREQQIPIQILLRHLEFLGREAWIEIVEFLDERHGPKGNAGTSCAQGVGI